MKEYSFYDTGLDESIENAFQALALDEQRAAFTPALWEKSSRSTTILRQVWFPGVHSNVGGGYPDQEVSNITLAWMIAQLEPFIDFHPNYIQEQHHATYSYYEKSGQEPRPWSFGEIYNSRKAIFALGGKKIRTPGAYYRIDSATGRPTRKLLKNTNEFIHPSVRSRSFLNAPGVEDKGLYESKAMQDYKLKYTGSRPPENMPLAVWQSRAKKKGVPRKTLRESPLWNSEKKLLQFSPKVQKFIYEDPDRSK
ncbi:MAG: hypothetical protein LQ340_001763 [Diploschistes diacapsis]|nr:MAG: hypothetical protein LQ340_001763 [Diploschistes diacapsis]